MKTLEVLDEPGLYDELERQAAELERGIIQVARQVGVPACVQRVGSMMCLYFCEGPVTCLDDVTASDRERWSEFFMGMLERGVILPPSPYEAWFLSSAHDSGTISQIVEAAQGALA